VTWKTIRLGLTNLNEGVVPNKTE